MAKNRLEPERKVELLTKNTKLAFADPHLEPPSIWIMRLDSFNRALELYGAVAECLRNAVKVNPELQGEGFTVTLESSLVYEGGKCEFLYDLTVFVGYGVLRRRVISLLRERNLCVLTKRESDLFHNTVSEIVDDAEEE